MPRKMYFEKTFTPLEKANYFSHFINRKNAFKTTQKCSRPIHDRLKGVTCQFHKKKIFVWEENLRAHCSHKLSRELASWESLSLLPSRHSELLHAFLMWFQIAVDHGVMCLMLLLLAYRMKTSWIPQWFPWEFKGISQKPSNVC